MSDLKPCPFCGGRPEWTATPNTVDGYPTVKCATIFCGVSLEGPTIERAEAKWNNRIAELERGAGPFTVMEIDGTRDNGKGLYTHSVLISGRQRVEIGTQLYTTPPPADAREIEALEALVHVTAHLVAATSLLERGGRVAAPSDKMFVQMLKDYKNAVEVGRKTIERLDEQRADAAMGKEEGE